MSSSSSSPPQRFDLSQLPSLVKDGMTEREEASKRRGACRFLDRAGSALQFPRLVAASAMYLFHRFYAEHAVSDQEPFPVAIASVLLAAKIEESKPKLKDVILECYKLKNGASTSESSDALTLNPEGEEYAKLKEDVVRIELILLHTIGVEVSIEHPHTFAQQQIESLMSQENEMILEFIPGTPEAAAVGPLSSQQMREKMQALCVKGCVREDAASISSDTTGSLCFNPLSWYRLNSISFVQQTGQWILLSIPCTRAFACSLILDKSLPRPSIWPFNLPMCDPSKTLPTGSSC